MTAEQLFVVLVVFISGNVFTSCLGF